MFKIASWNLNSVRSRLTRVTAWLKVRKPDVLLLQELKGTEFPSEAFKSLGYDSVAVTQKAYNGVAILSRHPMKTIAKEIRHSVSLLPRVLAQHEHKNCHGASIISRAGPWQEIHLRPAVGAGSERWLASCRDSSRQSSS
jgi:exonuclease III